MTEHQSRRLPWRGADVRKSHTAGFDDELDPADYSEIEESYAGARPGPDGPNWNDDAEGYGDPRHGRPAVLPPHKEERLSTESTKPTVDSKLAPTT